jgi:hypothetical protein
VLAAVRNKVDHRRGEAEASSKAAATLRFAARPAEALSVLLLGSLNENGLRALTFRVEVAKCTNTH